MNLNNLKIVILLIIVFVLAVSAIFYFYQKRIIKNVPLTELATPSPAANFPTSSANPSTFGSQSVPNSQPQTGFDTQDVKNIGISLLGPQQSEKISSPVLVSGRANVLGNIVVVVKDANGNILGEGKTTACVGYDACPFEAAVDFSQSSTPTGTVEVYNPSGVDGSPKYLQVISVRF